MSHIKHMHEMIEKLTECTLKAIESNQVTVGQYPIGDVVDMIKDLACAEKDARISKAMEEEEHEEEEQEKYMLRELKEMYGEDEEKVRKGYDSWRYDNGRFAPKVRGHRTRRGFMPMWDDGMMDMDMYGVSDANKRDIDKHIGRMYYSGDIGGMHSYTDGYSDGDRDGHMRGYEQGMMDGRKMSSGTNRDRREGRSGRARMSYMQTKEMNRGNTPQEKDAKMKDLESYMKDLSEDVTEMIMDATPEEKTMLKNKMQVLMQKIM